MKQNKFIQGYCILDEITFTDEQKEQFNQVSKQYFLVFDELKTISGRTLFYLAMRDKNLIENQVDEGNVTPGILTLFSPRNPDILCIHNMDGSYLGTTLIKTPAEYDEDDNLIKEEIITVQGEPSYALQKDKYIKFMDDIVTYDEEGNELSRVKPTVCKPIRLFSGFTEPRFD